MTKQLEFWVKSEAASLSVLFDVFFVGRSIRSLVLAKENENTWIYPYEDKSKAVIVWI